MLANYSSDNVSLLKTACVKSSSHLSSPFVDALSLQHQSIDDFIGDVIGTSVMGTRIVQDLGA